MTREKSWVNIASSNQDDGKIACKITSSSDISFYRDKGLLFDMKVYVRGQGRVYHLFAATPGDTIHIDVYMSNGGESAGMEADFKVTEQGVEVVRSRTIEATVSSN